LELRKREIHVFGFRGTPLLLRVWLGLDRSSLAWVYDKPGFSGRFCSGDSSVERGMARSSRIKIEKSPENKLGGPSCRKRTRDRCGSWYIVY
jgi:hypothetical protein